MMPVSIEAGKPELDFRAMERFAGVVYDGLEGFVAIRQIGADAPRRRKPVSSYPSVDEIASRCARSAAAAAEAGSGLFAVPAIVAKPGSAKAAEVTATRVVLIDLDAGDIQAKRHHLEKHLGEPTLVVASGGVTPEGQDKLHLYWKLDEPARDEDLALVRHCRAEIARKAGGDPAFASLHQPIRVPGSIHIKAGRLTPVRLLAQSGTMHDLGRLVAAIEAMPAAPGVEITSTSADKPAVRDVMVKKTRAGAIDRITRFDAISMVIGHWLRQVRSENQSLEDAWQAVREHNQAMIMPPWDEEDLRREFDALRARDIASHASAAAHAAVPLSEDDLANRLSTAIRGYWRYVPAWGRWMHWTGAVWCADATDSILDIARKICRQAASAEGGSRGQRISAKRTHDAVVAIARTDPIIAAPPDIWDRYPMLLNTPAGIVDLATGTVGPHDPGMMLTQMTSASPGSGCTRWLGFLEAITDGDQALAAYLQRFFGYCLTGLTREHAMLFLHGPGANGKSVLIQTIASVIGDYARTAAAETFTESRSDRHSTDLAGLRGARLVLVNETEAGKAWAEGRLKTVTGGDKVRARFMHRDFFEYGPQYKLMVTGNHRPVLRTVGEAMRRRLHLVNIDRIIPSERRDPNLIAKLLEERDGILTWMIDGCLEWQRTGLQPPDWIREAVDTYLEDEDLVGQWIAEQCDSGPTFRATSLDLFTSWSSWASARGHDPGNTRTFGLSLSARGHIAERFMGSRAWRGLRLRMEG